MRLPSKPKTSLGDLNLINVEGLESQVPGTAVLAESDDDDFPKIHKVRKGTHSQRHQPDLQSQETHVVEDAIPTNKPQSTAGVSGGPAPNLDPPAQKESAEAQGDKSDMDWMRSRTSRLLGLVEDDDDDDDEERPITQQISGGKPAVTSTPTAALAVNDTSDSRNKVLHPTEDSSQEEETAEAEDDAILGSGRLFLRNLAYSVTEEEIRELLAPDGDIQEVRVHNPSVIISSTLCDELPDRDSLCSQVMSTGTRF